MAFSAKPKLEEIAIVVTAISTVPTTLLGVCIVIAKHVAPCIGHCTRFLGSDGCLSCRCLWPSSRCIYWSGSSIWYLSSSPWSQSCWLFSSCCIFCNEGIQRLVDINNARALHQVGIVSVSLLYIFDDQVLGLQRFQVPSHWHYQSCQSCHMGTSHASSIQVCVRVSWVRGQDMWTRCKDMHHILSIIGKPTSCVTWGRRCHTNLIDSVGAASKMGKACRRVSNRQPVVASCCNKQVIVLVGLQACFQCLPLPITSWVISPAVAGDLGSHLNCIVYSL